VGVTRNVAPTVEPNLLPVIPAVVPGAELLVLELDHVVTVSAYGGSAVTVPPDVRLSTITVWASTEQRPIAIAARVVRRVVFMFLWCSSDFPRRGDRRHGGVRWPAIIFRFSRQGCI